MKYTNSCSSGLHNTTYI